MIKKYSFTLLITFLFCQLTFGQVKRYTPSWKNQFGKTPEGHGKTNSSGDPVGLWSFYYSGPSDQDKPNETFNYSNNAFTQYGNYGILLGKGQLNSDFQRTGKWREYNISSEFNYMKKKGNYYDGEKHGKWLIYSLDSLKSIGFENYTNGVPSGRWITHDYLTDELISEENYKNGKYEGTVIKIEPYGRGSQKTVSTYAAGVKNGLEKRYLRDEESRTISSEEGHYADGKEAGEWNIYNSTGVRGETIIYDEGTPIRTKSYYSTGELLSETPYTEFQKQGTFIQYHRNGKVRVKLTYKHGQIMSLVEMKDSEGKTLDGGNLTNGNGTLKEYDENGTLSSVLKFEKSKQISVQNYRDGELATMNIYYEGENNGKEIHYENGKKKLEIEVKGSDGSISHFENNLITKKEIYLGGEKIKTILYENGVEVETKEE